MNKDKTIDILDEIDLHIEALENDLDYDTDILEEADSNFISLLSTMSDENKPADRKQSSFENLNGQISQRINDLEVAITQDRATQLFSKSNIDPIFFKEDGIEFLVTPTSAPQIHFPRRTNNYSYYAKILIGMAVSISNQAPINMTMNLRIRFILDDDANIKPTIILCPRFIKDNVFYNPFSKVPVRHQQKILNLLITEIEVSLTKNPVRLDNFNFGDIQIKSNPSNFIINRGYLLFFSKVLPKRKLPAPIISYINRGYTQAIKIKDKIIEREIRKQVSGIASLNSIIFKDGFIRISTSKSYSEKILHIKVKTWVRIDYRLYFTVSNLTELSLDARWAEWEYKIKAKRCWPVCSNVINIAKRIVISGINKNKYFTKYIGSFWANASRIRTRITSNGLQIDMRAR